VTDQLLVGDDGSRARAFVEKRELAERRPRRERRQADVAAAGLQAHAGAPARDEEDLVPRRALLGG
jgi:hypothetical protein